MNGEVIWFNPMRSYGFIACDDNEEDAYVGYQDIIGDGYRTLNAGQRVQFRLIAQGDGEFKAVEVTGPNGAPIDNDLKNLPPRGDSDKPRARQSRRRESTRGGGGGRGGRVSRGGGRNNDGGGGGGGGRSQYKRRDARDESDEKSGDRRRERKGAKAVASKGKGKVLRGEVVWFNARRGYGWISVPNEKEDAYVSYGDIKADGYARLNDGEEVEFKLMRQDGGDLKAVEVTAPGGGPINNDLKRGGSGRGGGRGDRARDRRDYR